MLNEVAHDIWLESKAAHVIRQYTLPAGERYLDLPDTDIIFFANLQVRTQDAPLSPPNEAGIYDSDTSPRYTKEKTYQKNIEEGGGYYQDIGDRYAREHVTTEFRNGRYRIQAISEFEDGDVLHAHCIVHQPRYAWLLVGTSTDPMSHLGTDSNYLALDPSDPSLQNDLIWEPFKMAFITGTAYRAAEQHYRYVQDRSTLFVAQSNKQLYYDRYLPSAIHYIHSLKDSTSTLQLRPFRYLDE